MPKVKSESRLFSHPSFFLDKILKSYSDIECFELSLYEYRPQSVEDKRRTIEVKPDRLSNAYKYLQGEADPSEEIAIHSKVELSGGVIKHIPMLDLEGDFDEKRLDEFTSVLDEVFSDFRLGEVSIFSSGRSCHVYANTLIDDDDWQEFMGRALLLNLPDRDDFVDQRWVGHRLIAGYCSLRWSNNSGNYLQEPAEVFRYVTESPET